MILVDLNQIMYSTILHNLTQKNNNPELDIGIIRHVALNVLRSINKKFKNDYGEMILAIDSYKYWRKDFFPYYKANRKKARQKSPLDWPSIFQCMNNFKAELKEIKLYKYIEVEGAEADDIIASLVQKYYDQDILIVSGDKDFAQLQKHRNVKQYDILNKKFIKVSDPLKALEEHIIKGDPGDGIPNILSNDNCFVLGQRQKNITKKFLQNMNGMTFHAEHEYTRNYSRNKTLIDLEMIPTRIKENVLKVYEEQQTGNRSELFNYLIKNKLKNLLESINDF